MPLRTKNHFAIQLGQKIREMRITRNMSISELALESCLDYTQLSRIELGKINTSVYTVYQISVALDVSMDKLFRDIR
jgi:transcriptional regulator with XRE-family HTH domain